MMKRFGIFLAAFFGLVVLMSLGVSNEAQAQQTPRVNQVQRNQVNRIQHGVRNGELTRAEAHRLAAEQRHVHRDKRRAQADGVVTPRERKHIRTEQREANRHIARQKHDGQDRN